MVNKLLTKLDNRYFRWILIILIRLMYASKGKEFLEKVYFDPTLRLWGYQFKSNFFWNVGPGWVTGKEYFESQLHHYFANQYQPKKGDVVIDLGAGLGEEMIILAGWVGLHGKIYAVEATPRIAKALTFAKEANELQNVFIYNIAISNKNEPVEIADEIGYVGNTIQSVAKNNSNLLTVRGLTLDCFIDEQEINHVDLLKVNIEGAEQFMIMGMDKCISKIENIAVSCHDFRYTVNKESEFYKTMDKIKSYFVSKGFSILVLPSEDILQSHIVFGKNLAFKQ